MQIIFIYFAGIYAPYPTLNDLLHTKWLITAAREVGELGSMLGKPHNHVQVATRPSNVHLENKLAPEGVELKLNWAELEIQKSKKLSKPGKQNIHKLKKKKKKLVWSTSWVQLSIE